jgi:hypothetical protein
MRRKKILSTEDNARPNRHDPDHVLFIMIDVDFRSERTIKGARHLVLKSCCAVPFTYFQRSLNLERKFGEIKGAFNFKGK